MEDWQAKHFEAKFANACLINKIEHLQKRNELLQKELATLYTSSYTIKVESFFKTMIAWAKGGFKRLDKAGAGYRLAICSRCPYKAENKCGVCGCFLEKKAKVPQSKCPIQKW